MFVWRFPPAAPVGRCNPDRLFHYRKVIVVPTKQPLAALRVLYPKCFRGVTYTEGKERIRSMFKISNKKSSFFYFLKCGGNKIFVITDFHFGLDFILLPLLFCSCAVVCFFFLINITS